MTVAAVEYLLRSPDASWTDDRWEQLPNDGNHYEVIDGVLCRSTAPSFWHQRSIIRLMQHVATPLEANGVAIAAIAPLAF